MKLFCKFQFFSIQSFVLCSLIFWFMTELSDSGSYANVMNSLISIYSTHPNFRIGTSNSASNESKIIFFNSLKSQEKKTRQTFLVTSAISRGCTSLNSEVSELRCHGGNSLIEPVSVICWGIVDISWTGWKKSEHHMIYIDKVVLKGIEFYRQLMMVILGASSSGKYNDNWWRYTGIWWWEICDAIISFPKHEIQQWENIIKEI